MRAAKRAALGALLALFCVLASGCLIRPLDELYALPQQAAEYYDLQNAIEEILHGGAEYCAPSSGENQQAVQLADVDGDGEDEAVAFFRVPGDKPLKIYVFDRQGEHYEQLAVIEGDGTAFASVDYRQIDGVDGNEIVVARKISDQTPQMLSVYALRQGRVDELLSVSTIRYTTADLNSDGLQDLLTLRADSNQTNGIADLYCWQNDTLICRGTVNLSVPVNADSIRRIFCGQMQRNVSAVFVAGSVDDDTILTDVLVLRAGEFCNVAQMAEAETGAKTARYRSIYAVDIDGDGLIELPSTLRLQNLRADDKTEYYMINWYNLTLNGQKVFRRATYHNYTDGWYVELPDQWNLTPIVDYATDTDGYAGYHFYESDGTSDAPDWLFTIYSFSGGNARELAQADGRFILGEKGDVVYSAALQTESTLPELSQERLKELFHFIYTDWNTGEL